MSGKEVFYISDNKRWRVCYSMWDLGDKYKLEKWDDDYGMWRHMGSYASPGAAMTAMKRAAGEWHNEWT